MLRVLACLISIGKEFHSFGANEEKALSPINLKRVKGTVRRPVSDKRRSRVWILPLNDRDDRTPEKRR